MSRSNLQALLEQFADFFKANGAPSPTYEYVLTHGKTWTPAPLPDGIRQGEAKECFTNALGLAFHHDLDYVEGYASSSRIGIPIHHAWCVDESGRVIDPTWDEPQDCEYLGVVFDMEWVLSLGWTGLALETAARAEWEERSSCE